MADEQGQGRQARTLPHTREELLALHAAERRKRDAAPLGSEEQVAALDEIARIEIEIARLERSMNPPQM